MSVGEYVCNSKINFSFYRSISADRESTDFSSPLTLPCQFFDLRTFQASNWILKKIAISNASNWILKKFAISNASALVASNESETGTFLSLSDLNHFSVASSSSLNVEVFVFFRYGLNSWKAFMIFSFIFQPGRQGVKGNAIPFGNCSLSLFSFFYCNYHLVFCN